ncbi:MAG: galactose oxidase [Pseudarcicella sp.]|nr:galactose oxidase [Pseudarcicella sp.]
MLLNKSLFYKAIILCFFTGTNFYLNAQSAWESIPLAQATDVLKRHECGLSCVDNQWILLGGRGNKVMNIFDPSAKKWKQGAMPPLEIHHFQAVHLDGLLYIVGAFTGRYPYETPLSNVLIYDMATDVWTIGATIPAHRRRGSAGVITYKGKIYVVNGIINGHSSGWVNWLDEYDPTTNLWKELTDSPRERDHFQASVAKDKIYVASGRKSGFKGDVFKHTVAETDIYDFKTNTWITLPAATGNIPTQRAGASSIEAEGNVYIIGGESTSQGNAHSEVEMLDTQTNLWLKRPSLLEGRHGSQAFVQNGSIYTIAGNIKRGGGNEINTIEKYRFSEYIDTLQNFPRLKNVNVKTNVDSLVFTKNATFTVVLDNSQSEKAQVISNVIVSGNKQFKLEFSTPTPFVIAPKTSREIKVKFVKAPQSNLNEGVLQIKTLSGKPLFVKLITRI